MLLAINANNTNCKFALFDDGEKIGDWRISTRATRTADEYAVWLSQLMALVGRVPADVTSAIIAIVVPQALFELKVLCKKYFHCTPLVVGEPDVDLGIQVLLDQPQEAGADRLVNAVAAHGMYGGPLVVVDFGTSTTFDIVDSAGDYVGGIIAPGVNLSVDALYVAAAKLPRIAVEKADRVIGKNTVEAMKSGVFWGYVGLIEGLIDRICGEMACDGVKVIATGGLAPLFFDSTDHLQILDPDLTMKGLVEIHRRNAKARP
ncbi:MAG: type III pantothenate kinase [Hyphomicrobiales bacterium]|nr:type III pantothenate kinase [Hyphomicrobiales bacterium]MCP5372858.1 type III pantothenate kinase [Hyphomicrobiales bacterium]